MPDDFGNQGPLVPPYAPGGSPNWGLNSLSQLNQSVQALVLGVNNIRGLIRTGAMPWVLKAGDTMTGPLVINLHPPTTPATPLPPPLSFFVNGTVLHGAANDGEYTSILLDSAGSSNRFSNLYLRNSRGTIAAPAPTQNADYLGAVYFAGRGATGFGSSNNISFSATENWSDTAQGAEFQVQVDQIGTNTVAARLRLRLGLMITDIGGNPPTGGDMGAGTINIASSPGYYINGVPIMTAMGGPFLPLTGGTLTGPLLINTATAYPLSVVGSTGSQIHFNQANSDDGGYLIGGPSQAVLSGGTSWNGANWVAKSSAAEILSINGGTLNYYQDTGLVVGSTYTPTPQWTIDANGHFNVQTNSIFMGASLQTGQGASTGDCAIELGGFRTDNGNSYIDFHSSVGSDFDFRIFRAPGPNGNALITQAGTGGIQVISNGNNAILVTRAGNTLFSSDLSLNVPSQVVISTGSANDGNNYGQALQIIRPAAGGQYTAFILAGTAVYSLGYKPGTSSVFGFGNGTTTDSAFDPAILNITGLGSLVAIGASAVSGYSPGAILALYDNGAHNYLLALKNDIGNGYTQMAFIAGHNYQMGVGNPSVGSGLANKWYVYDQPSGVFRIVLDTDGSVGIGTNGIPHAGLFDVEVATNNHFAVRSLLGGTQIFGSTNSAAAYAQLAIDASPLLINTSSNNYIQFGGAVGIGHAPYTTFTVHTGTDQNFLLRPATDFSLPSGVAIQTINDANSAMVPLYIEAQPLGLNVASGNPVGIGVTPSAGYGAKLVVRTGTDEVFLVRSMSAVIGGVSGIALSVVNDANNTWEKLEIDGSQVTINAGTGGNVGIGIATPVNNPGYITLSINGVNGGVVQFLGSGNTYGQIYAYNGGLTFNANNASGAVPIFFQINGAEQMRLSAGGYLLVQQTAQPAGFFPIATQSGIQVKYASGNGGFGLVANSSSGMDFYTYTGAPGSESYAFQGHWQSNELRTYTPVVSDGTNAIVEVMDRGGSGHSSGVYRSGPATRLWDDVAGDVIIYDNSAQVAIGSGATPVTNQALSIVTRDNVLATNIIGFSFNSSNSYRSGIGVAYDGGTPNNNAMVFRVSDGTTTGQVNVMQLVGGTQGYVGIGTVPNARLHAYVAGDDRAILLASGSAKGVRIGTDASNGYVEAVDNGGRTSFQNLVIGGASLNFQTGSNTRLLIVAGLYYPGLTDQGANTINFSKYYSNNLEVLQFDGNYVEMYDGAGNPAIFYGGGGGSPDHANYYRNSVHQFQTIGGGSSQVQIGPADVYFNLPPISGVDNAQSCGISTNRWTAVWAVNGTIQTSDGRSKTDLADCDLGLDFICSLKPCSWRFVVGGNRVVEQIPIRNEVGHIVGHTPVVEAIPGKRRHYGLVAQEVKEALGNRDFGGWIQTDMDDPDSEQALRYDQFIAPLIAAVQELAAEVADLRSRLLC